MKPIMLVLFSIFFTSVISAQTSENTLGKEITLTEKTSISDILANPENYLEKTVLVEGEILEVCPKMGCWMDLSSGADGEKIKVKVKDGEIIFPVEAVGSNALVEGKVYKLELSQEDASEYFKHIAEESGKTFDPGSVKGPVTLYQIKGFGVKIYDKEG